MEANSLMHTSVAAAKAAGVLRKAATALAA